MSMATGDDEGVYGVYAPPLGVSERFYKVSISYANNAHLKTKRNETGVFNTCWTICLVLPDQVLGRGAKPSGSQFHRPLPKQSVQSRGLHTGKQQTT